VNSELKPLVILDMAIKCIYFWLEFAIQWYISLRLTVYYFLLRIFGGSIVGTSRNSSYAVNVRAT
jgi:hypothetical protein